MIFTVLERGQSPPKDSKNHSFLITDHWDDWAKFRTMFRLIVFDNEGKQYDIGSVKIGQFGLEPCPAGKVTRKGQRSPDIPAEFQELTDQFFSIGQDEDYYEMLYTVPNTDLTIEVFNGLKDCAYDLELFGKAINEEVLNESLLRDVRLSSVKERYHRLAHGNAQLTEYKFEYIFPKQGDNTDGPTISFSVKPDSIPPSNIHVLIGRNGVGKTRCISNFTNSISQFSNPEKSYDYPFGTLRSVDNYSDEFPFSGIVSITFSAFDSFRIPDFSKSKIRYNYVGLWEETPDNEEPMNPIEWNKLSEDFCNSFDKCRKGLRSKRWIEVVQALENDPLFSENQVTSLIDLSRNDWSNFFSRLSSGHAIVLLTITRLVELVDERTLIMIDEPESHLHPPLLSAFVRAISDLLIKRNGVAIIATHSPVVLQEVPKSCVWKLSRTGTVTVAERPIIETFGENVSVLTRHIFGLEVTNSGFHALLRDAIETKNLDYDAVLELFNHQLGAEGKAIAQGLIAERNR